MKSQLMIDWETAMETQRKKCIDERVRDLSWGLHIVLEETMYFIYFGGGILKGRMDFIVRESTGERNNPLDGRQYTKSDKERSVKISVKINHDGLPIIEEEILREVLKEVMVRSVINT